MFRTGAQQEHRGFRILKKERLTPATNRFVIEAPWVARSASPGQFVIVRVHERGERIPVTIADFDAAAGTVTVVMQEVGRTSKLFGALMEGEAVRDLVGPLGEPFRLMREKRVTPPPGSPANGGVALQREDVSKKCDGSTRGGALPGGGVIGVGGGFGAAALYPLIRALHDAGSSTEVVVGARTRSLLILEAELSRVCRQVFPCTDDGSYGFKGFVTDRLRLRLDELGRLDDVEVVAVGPMPMMRAVAAVTAPFRVPTQVSLDPIMVDGTGMCGGCRVTVGGEVKFACVDGPFFDAHQVDFAECVRRNKMYASVEREVNAAEARS